MTVLLDDPTQPLDTPPGSPIEPAAPLDAIRQPEERLTSYDLVSRGGYSRTVVGRIAFFDREANTYVVRDRVGGLTRVPVREITSSEDVDPSHT